MDRDAAGGVAAAILAVAGPCSIWGVIIRGRACRAGVGRCATEAIDRDAAGGVAAAILAVAGPCSIWGIIIRGRACRAGIGRCATDTVDGYRGIRSAAGIGG